MGLELVNVGGIDTITFDICHVDSRLTSHMSLRFRIVYPFMFRLYFIDFHVNVLGQIGDHGPSYPFHLLPSRTHCSEVCRCPP